MQYLIRENVSSFEELFAQIFDITAELAERDCDSCYEKLFDSLADIIVRKTKSRDYIVCKEGCVIYIEKKPTGILVEIK